MELLFDNKNDPLQMNNLSQNPQYADIRSELKNKMFAKMKEIGDKFENNSYYEANWVEDRIIKRTATLNP